MEYTPIVAVWEITMACNMQCKHCGSSCGEFAPDELTLDEALALCDDMGELGLQLVTLSGGEPFVRKDWHIIARRLKENKITPNIISNGWIIDEEIADKAIEVGIESIGISLDGTESTHNFMRREGSYVRALKSYDLLRRKGIVTSAVTTVNRKNISELEEVRKALIEHGVQRWQLQIGLPMGNFANHMDMIIKPSQMDQIIDFAYEASKDDRIAICLADCMGYYNKKALKVLERYYRDLNQSLLWDGCYAGKYGMGIRCNGDITGCTSVRNKEYIEGNIRKRSIKDIWTDPESFKWTRELDKEKLTGFCGKCRYGAVCLGGCTNSKLTLAGTLYENTYCSYRVAVEKASSKVHTISDFDQLLAEGSKLMEKREFQVAEIYFKKAEEIQPQNLWLLSTLGYVNFMLQNYSISAGYNRSILEIEPENTYALSRLGVCQSKLGMLEEGISSLKKSIELSGNDYMDPYYDLAVILSENDRRAQALEILDQGRARSEEFIKVSEELYSALKA